MVSRNSVFRSENERGLMCQSADFSKNMASFVHCDRLCWEAGNAG